MPPLDPSVAVLVPFDPVDGRVLLLSNDLDLLYPIDDERCSASGDRACDVLNCLE